MLLFLRSGIGGWTGAGRSCVTSKINSAAPASFFRRCKYRTMSVPNLRVRAGGRVSSIIYLLLSPKAQPLAHRRPAAGALGEGPGDDSDFDLAHYFDLAHLTSGRRSVAVYRR